jgi:hypothetical protein
LVWEIGWEGICFPPIEAQQIGQLKKKNCPFWGNKLIFWEIFFWAMIIIKFSPKKNKSKNPTSSINEGKVLYTCLVNNKQTQKKKSPKKNVFP